MADNVVSSDESSGHNHRGLVGVNSPHREGRPARFTRIMERCSERDRAWFERHPEEPAYVRVQVPGEFWPAKAGHGDLTLVECLYSPLDGTPIGRTRSPVLTVRAVRASVNGGRMLILHPDGTAQYESVATEGVAR